MDFAANNDARIGPNRNPSGEQHTLLTFNAFSNGVSVVFDGAGAAKNRAPSGTRNAKMLTPIYTVADRF